MVRLLRRASMLVALCIVSGGTILALDPAVAITQYVCESWTIQNGAPSGTITGIAQTPDGYLWLGTEGDGLVRFDGVSFVHSQGLDTLFGSSTDRITSLLCSRDGALWVGTYLGLARLKDGRWKAFDQSPGNVVFGLHEAADGAVWYGRHWTGLYRVQGDQVTHLPLSGKPRFVTTDKWGVLWVGGYDGIWRLKGEERRLYTKRDGLKDIVVNQIFGDREGNVWVATPQGLTKLQGNEFSAHFTNRDGLSDHDIRAIYEDKNGLLWIGTASGGLNRRRGNRFDSLTKILGLANNRVTAIYEDREGSMWIGTAGGLSRLRDASLLPIGTAEGLSSLDTKAIVVEKDNTVAVASGYAGLNRIKDGRIHSTKPDSVRGSDFDGAMFASPDGSLWTGHLNGLSCRRGDQGTNYPVNGAIACISRDSQSIIFATGKGEVFRLVDGKPQRYLLADGSPLGSKPFEFDYVWMMYLSHAGDLWLGTSRGAFIVRDGKVRQAWKGSLSTRSISEDEDRTIWLGTMDGVVRWTKQASRLFTTTEGLPQNDIYYVQGDRYGFLWMSGSRGISRIQRRELEAVAQGKSKAFRAEVFGAVDGMRTSEATATYEPAGCATKDGRLWFSTAEGVVIVDPSRIRMNTLPPPVLVEKILADDAPIEVTPEITLGPGVHRFVIHYNGLSLLMPRRVRFKYKLEGYDRDWIDAEGSRVASYTKLPPGSYTFRVIAANNDGVWNEVGATLKIRKLPYFYQTIWFLTLAGLALVAGAFGLHRFRLRMHIRAERELQARVREALTQISTLTGLLPVCAWCKKIRDDNGHWSRLEDYVSKHTQAEVSHGICPECREKFLDAAPPSEDSAST